MKKHITKFLILTIILTAALSVNYLFAAWVGPTQAPPGGNTSAPIHVGSTNQVKDGGLSVNALSVFGSEYVQGNLDVDGGIEVGNTTNTNAGTIRWTGADFEGYDGTQWVSLVSGETVVVSVCTFSYSEWSACNPTTRTRTVTSTSPPDCLGGSPITTKSCTASYEPTGSCEQVYCDGYQSMNCTTKSNCTGCWYTPGKGGSSKWCEPGPEIWGYVYR